MIEVVLKIFFGLFFFFIFFVLDLLYISKKIIISFVISLLISIYIIKLIENIFIINSYFYIHDKKSTITTIFKNKIFEIKKYIYINSIIIFIAGFLIMPYVIIFLNKNNFIVIYINSILLFIPSITIIQAK